MKKSKDQILEDAIREAKASLEFEGFTITDEDIELIKKKARGEISKQEFSKLAKEKAKHE